MSPAKTSAQSDRIAIPQLIMVRATSIFTTAVTATLYGCVGFLLYRSRVLYHTTLLASDFVVFFGPFLLALLILVWAVHLGMPDAWPPATKTLGAILIAFVVTAAIACTYCAIAFNMYGS